MQTLVIISGISAFICLCVGLPTYLCGCDPVIDPYCYRYNTATAYPIAHYITSHTCSNCVLRTQTCNDVCSRSYRGTEDEPRITCHQVCTLICTVYNYYPCYDSYVILTYSNNNTCILQVTNDDISSQDAYDNSVSLYPNNIEVTIYLDDDTCYSQSQVRDLAIVGLVFLCLMGLFLIPIIIQLLISCHITRFIYIKNEEPDIDLTACDFDYDETHV